jgi:uncharacterized Fe-S cluster protein YjdI
MEEKRYANADITVVWKPEVCIHSTKCWKSLLPVFDPRKRPWVNLEGAATERIIQTVENCPSGALTYVKNVKDE